MSSSAESNSMELWAASKVIGRECATVNKEYFLCKKAAGLDPRLCAAKAELSSACASNIISTLNKDHGEKFVAFQKCLDFNDYRFHDCRETERALLDSWNTRK